MNRISLMTSVQSRRKLDLVSLFSKTNRFCMDCKDERCGGYLAKRTDFPAAVAPSEVKEHSTEDGPIDHDSEVTDSFTCVIRLEKMINIFFLLFPAVTKDPCSVDPDPVRLVCREFHVLYSLAYSVPTLYLRAWRSGFHLHFNQAHASRRKINFY